MRFLKLGFCYQTTPPGPIRGHWVKQQANFTTVEAEDNIEVWKNLVKSQYFGKTQKICYTMQKRILKYGKCCKIPIFWLNNKTILLQ